MIEVTVGSQVKSCFSSIKSAEATLALLSTKTKDSKAKENYTTAQQLLSDIKEDLQRQIMYLAREEPQYKQ